jgi:hypothetical protein
MHVVYDSVYPMKKLPEFGLDRSKEDRVFLLVVDQVLEERNYRRLKLTTMMFALQMWYEFLNSDTINDY